MLLRAPSAGAIAESDPTQVTNFIVKSNGISSENPHNHQYTGVNYFQTVLVL